MKRGTRIMVTAGCIVLLLVSWLVAITAKSNADKQRELIDQAAVYLQDEVYVLALPLLEEAAGYNDDYTLEAEELLKDIYLKLMDQTGYRKRYLTLLEKQMARKDASPDVFEEAARFYLASTSRISEALTILRTGIEKTNSEALIELYEENRYAFSESRSVYRDVTAICNKMIQVMGDDGKWGLAQADGTLLIPCQYDSVSTYYKDRVIVNKDGVVSAVDTANNRLALLHENALETGNYNNDRFTLRTADGWRLATGTFTLGSVFFEELGTYSGGYTAAKTNGKWGVVSTNGRDWLLQPEFDEIKCDDLGRCFAQNAVFVVKNGKTLLLVNGEQIGEGYEDARPFADGWAAVKINGKWGFIDTTGTIMIEPQFDDARSFGQHLAAVKIGERWGYISLSGKVVIEPVFLEARSFSDGSAPVLTELGWGFITLLEYKE